MIWCKWLSILITAFYLTKASHCNETYTLDRQLIVNFAMFDSQNL